MRLFSLSQNDTYNLIHKLIIVFIIIYKYNTGVWLFVSLTSSNYKNLDIQFYDILSLICTIPKFDNF